MLGTGTAVVAVVVVVLVDTRTDSFFRSLFKKRPGSGFSLTSLLFRQDGCHAVSFQSNKQPGLPLLSIQAC